jgi:hypothetical protein
VETDLEGALPDFLPAPYPAPLFAAGVQQLDFGEVRRPGRKRLTFKVSNIGGEGSLEVTLTPNLPNQQWFQVRPTQAVIPAGEDCVVDAEIDTAQEGCPLGRQELDIQIEAPGSMVQEIPRIRVTAEILPEIRLVADPPQIEFGEVSLGESATVTITIRRSDEREILLNERLVELVDDHGTPRPGWAEVEFGPSGRQQTVSVTFHTANRAVRDYYCQLRLADARPEVNRVTVPIHVCVTPPPELQLKWAIEPLPVFTGDLQEAQLAVGNVGGGMLRGRVAGDQPWLRVPGGAFEVRSGDAQMVAVRIGDPRLGAGVYHGQLEIASNDGGRSRVVRIPVELEVEGEEASPVQVVWERALGRFARGQRFERTLTVRNRMARPFEGTLISANPEWLRPREGGRLRLGPGEMKQVVVEANTRPLTAGPMETSHATTLRLVDAAGKECWADRAELVLLPVPRRLLLKVVLGLLLLALLLLAIAALRQGGQAVMLPGPASADGVSAVDRRELREALKDDPTNKLAKAKLAKLR